MNTLTYRVPWLRDRGGVLQAVAGGWEASSRFRYQSGQFLTPTGNSSIGGRRAEYVGGDIKITGDAMRWFNTDAFANPPEDRRGSALVGMIEGPSFTQLDMSFRKNFRFGGRYSLTPIFDVLNLFNTVNFQNPDVAVNAGAYGTISGAHPPRQFQMGARFDF